MSGKFNQASQGQRGWTVYRKKSAGGVSQFEKYDTELRVIVSKGKKPSHIYLTDLAWEKLGNPEAVLVLKDGSEVGFAPAHKGDEDSYNVAYTDSENKRGHRFINARGPIMDFGLRGGTVYNAYLHEDPPNRYIVINVNSQTSSL